MKNMLKEFKAFIATGDLVTVAVGLVMALYTKAIIDALLEGIIKPIIAMIFGKPDFTDIGFHINDAYFSVGLVLGAIVDFVAVAFVLFLILRAYNKFRAAQGAAGPTQVELLTEIRDELRKRG